MQEIALYLENLELNSELSYNSYRLYKRDLLDFEEFIKENFKSEYLIKDLNLATLEKFVSWLEQRGAQVPGINRKLTALKKLWLFLREKNLVERDPFSQLIRKKQPRREKAKTLSLDEIKQILFQKDIADYSRLILELLYSCALRVSELRKLTLADIDLNTQLITVVRNSKSRKTRLIPFSKNIKELIEAHIEKNQLKPEQKLLYTRQMDALGKIYYELPSAREIYRLIDACAKSTNIDKLVTASILRNSFIVHAQQKGAHAIFLKDLTGQKDFSYYKIK
jgi:site-specific recombinase XerD